PAACASCYGANERPFDAEGAAQTERTRERRKSNKRQSCERSGIHSRGASRGSGGCAASTPSSKTSADGAVGSGFGLFRAAGLAQLLEHPEDEERPHRGRVRVDL